MATPDAATLWADRFSQPGIDDLVAALDEPAAPRVEACREQLAAARPESLEWRGLGCGWTLCYRLPDGSDLAPIYLVLKPDAPHLLAPLDDRTRTDVERQGLSKTGKERLAAARIVGARRWLEWPLDSDTAAEEASRLLPMLLGHAPD